MGMVFDAITIEPNKKADAVVIWLPGLGADGYDFVDAVPSLGLGQDHSIRFIFPHAPSQPVTLNNNFVMPAWYDIFALEFNAPEDEKGIKQAEEILGKLIDSVITQGIASTRIFLLGFSQGGALAIHTALRFNKPLAGVGVLSGWLPLRSLLLKEQHVANANIPIFMGHGSQDPLVPEKMGQYSYKLITEAGHEVDWHSYPMEHTVCLPELKDIGKWIQQCLHTT
jgi:phospholipase/carboxylesterase